MHNVTPKFGPTILFIDIHYRLKVIKMAGIVESDDQSNLILNLQPLSYLSLLDENILLNISKYLNLYEIN